MFNDPTKSRRLIFPLFLLSVFSLSIISCKSDDPEDNNQDEATSVSIVSANQLAGEWTLCKNQVLFSQVNPDRGDEVIDYSVVTAPYYRYYRVTVIDDNILYIQEKSASNSNIGQPLEYLLTGNNLTTLDGETIVGTIEKLDPKHSWDNIRIKWNKGYSPVFFDAPVVSTYLLMP